MPGRLAFDAAPLTVATLFGLADVPASVKPDYNVAPYEAVSVVAGTAPISARPEKDRQSLDSSRRIFRARWGLHPHWAEDRNERPAPFNAPAAKVATSGTYRKSFAERRGLVPVSGFYIWPESGSATRVAPFYVRFKDRRLFAIAAVWDEWWGEYETMVSAATITTEPNELLAAFARSGPAVIRPEDFAAWFDPSTPMNALAELLKPFPVDEWEAYRLTNAVNHHGWDGPHGVECIAPAGLA